MKIGQLYKIKYITYYSGSDTGTKEKRIAKLIFENKYFYTFEYKSKMGDMLRVCLDKYDKSNAIQEV